MLLCSGCFIYFFTLYSLAAKERYPDVNCKEISNYFGNNTEKWESHAFITYTKNMDLLKNYKPTDFEGTMQCYCDMIRTDNPKDWKKSIKYNKKDV